jgi:hypothetical protein
MVDPRTPAVIHAARSTADERGAIPTQTADCEHAIERERRELVGNAFSDEGSRGYRRSRGPRPDPAKRRRAELAAQRGAADLWWSTPIGSLAATA